MLRSLMLAVCFMFASVSGLSHAQIGVCCSYCAGPDQCQNAGEATFTKCQISHLGELTWCDTVGTGYCRVCNPFSPSGLQNNTQSQTSEQYDVSENIDSEVPPRASYDRDQIIEISRTNPGLASLLSIVMMRIGTGQPIPLKSVFEESALFAFDDASSGAGALDQAHRTGALTKPVSNPGSRGRGIAVSFAVVELERGQTLVRIAPEDPAMAARLGGTHEAVLQKIATTDGVFVKVMELR
jgi:hypothetical protein